MQIFLVFITTFNTAFSAKPKAPALLAENSTNRQQSPSKTNNKTGTSANAVGCC